MNATVTKYNLPPIPVCKIFTSEVTSEQEALVKCMSRKTLNDNDVIALKDAITFYKQLFPLLKAIDLSIISLEEAEDLKKYLGVVFNFNLMVSNDINFEFVFRISIIKDSFREKGKVRTPTYLKYPPLSLVKKVGVYNRANTNNKTVFYASFLEHVALRETKPQKGDKIILSVWKNITGKSFNSYPISNSAVANEGVQKATKAFQETKETIHPLMGEIMDLHFSFLASEFVKNSPIVNPKRLEYLYSAYFADRLLAPLKEGDPSPRYDFIIYPSVAWKHQHENIAMTDEALDTKMRIIHAVEYEVEDTFYDRELTLEEMPAKLRFIREAHWFEKDLIIWEDD